MNNPIGIFNSKVLKNRGLFFCFIKDQKIYLNKQILENKNIKLNDRVKVFVHIQDSLISYEIYKIEIISLVVQENSQGKFIQTEKGSLKYKGSIPVGELCDIEIIPELSKWHEIKSLGIK